MSFEINRCKKKNIQQKCITLEINVIIAGLLLGSYRKLFNNCLEMCKKILLLLQFSIAN